MFVEFNVKQRLYTQKYVKGTGYLNAYFKVILLIFLIIRVLDIVTAIVNNNLGDFTFFNVLHYGVDFAVLISYISVIVCDRFTFVVNLITAALLTIEYCSQFISTLASSAEPMTGMYSGIFNGFIGILAFFSAVFALWSIINVIYLIFKRDVFLRTARELSFN